MPAQANTLHLRDYFAIGLVILLWGLNFVPTKYALQDFTPFQLGAARYFLVVFPLIFFIRRPRIPLLLLIAFSLTQGVGQFGLLFFALESGMTAALGSVLMQTQIFFTAIMGASLLGEKISTASKIGMTLAGAGLCCVALSVTVGNSNGSALSSLTVVGFILTLCAAAMWASSNILIKHFQAKGLNCDPLALLVWSSLITSFLFMTISATFDPPELRWQWLQSSPTSLASVLYLGWLASGLAFWMWATLLTRHPASKVAPFSLGIPVVGLVAGIVALNEQVTLLQWVGSGLILSALVFVMVSSSRAMSRMSERYRRRRGSPNRTANEARND